MTRIRLIVAMVILVWAVMMSNAHAHKKCWSSFECSYGESCEKKEGKLYGHCE